MINREKLSGDKDKLRRAERILVIETLSSLSKIVYFTFQVFGESRSWLKCNLSIHLLL